MILAPVTDYHCNGAMHNTIVAVGKLTKILYDIQVFNCGWNTGLIRKRLVFHKKWVMEKVWVGEMEVETGARSNKPLEVED